MVQDQDQDRRISVLSGFETKTAVSRTTRLCSVPYLFRVHSPGCVERLYERGGLTDEQRIERSTSQHTDDRQPHIRDALWRVAAVADTQHV